MTSSGIIPVQPGANLPAASSGSPVQIVSLPEGLQNVSRAMRMQGEVVQQNEDGSTRIKTAEGNIDVVIRGRQPQPGAKIEMDMPAGSPPRSATVRPAPVQSAPVPTPQPPPTTTPVEQPPASSQPPIQNATPTAQPQKAGTAQPSPETAQTSQPQVRPASGDAQTLPPATTPATATKPPATPLPSLPPLQPGMVVTLKPLPALPAQPPTSSANPAPTVPSSAQQPTIVASLLQAVKTAIPDSAIQSLNEFISGNIAKTPAIPPSVPPQAAVQSLTVPLPNLSAKIVSITLPSGQILTAPVPTPAGEIMTGAILQTPQMMPVPSSPSSAVPMQPALTQIQPSTLTIIVEQVTPQNQPIVTIPMNNNGTKTQSFILQSPAATVPVGTQIVLQPQLNMQSGTPAQPPQEQNTQVLPQTPVATQPVPPTPTPTTLPPAWRALLPLMQPSTIWPAMDDVFQSFYQATPQAAQILARTIPSPANPANLGPSLLLFAAAAKAGDLQGWLGDKKLEMIHKIGKGDLVSRLSSETAVLASGSDASPTDWKSFPVPLLWQNEISRVLFHVRQEPRDKDNPDQEAGTRFVLDLALDRMGDVQLDGIVRGKRLDIILRTQIPVSIPMQEAMKKAYADALDGSDIFGELGFQGDMKQWMVVKRYDHENAVSV